MERREFLKALGAAGGMALVPGSRGALADSHAAAPSSASADSASARALAELLAQVGEADARWLGAEYGITRPADVTDGRRALLHVLETGMYFWLEADPERPVFKRYVTPHRKLLGDNPDAVYYWATIRPDRAYRVRGNLAGAVYASITVEGGSSDGKYGTGVVGTLNSDEFDVDSDGSFEVILSPTEREGRNWLKLAPDAGTLSTRHYFEEETSVAADASKVVPMSIEPLEDPGAPAPLSDDSVAHAIERVRNYVVGNTLGQPPRDPSQQPSWVSTVPNQFNPPEKPGTEIAFAAVDNAYAMAPYVLMPDEALVIEGRFPECRFANVVLWNRFLQTYDYAHRQVSLNRKQTKLEADGSYRMVVAHSDPGVPNWLDTEGRPTGVLYWRFMLPEGAVAKPEARVVELASLG